MSLIQVGSESSTICLRKAARFCAMGFALAAICSGVVSSKTVCVGDENDSGIAVGVACVGVEAVCVAGER